jgi:molecular chaperone DnaJ
MDLYIVLGVKRGATTEEIKRAYKRLARRYHPDINPGDRASAQQFRQIADAYATLSDPARRSLYDAHGTAAGASDASAFGFEGFDFSVRVSGDAASTFGDLFADIIEQRAAASVASASVRGADLHHVVALGFEEALQGGTRQIALTRQVTCRTCSGRGVVRTAETRCGRCRGAGHVRSARGHMVFSKVCAQCGGTGRLLSTGCPACHGAGTQARVETVQVRLPPGLSDGDRIRVASQGHAGAAEASPGDLYVVVRVEPHPVFRREGDDLHVVLPIAVHEAALGAKVEVQSIDGPARVRIPPGTQTGQRFRVRERGAPSPRGGPRGDLVVEVRMTLPKVLDERSRALLQEFGDRNAGALVRDGVTRP